MNKKQPKNMFLLALLLFSFLTGCLSGYQSVSAKTGLNHKKLSLKIGQQKKLRLKGVRQGKVKWKSSRPAVASVKKGVVTARKKGTATITAKYKKKKYKCRITVKKEASAKNKPAAVPSSSPQSTEVTETFSNCSMFVVTVIPNEGGGGSIQLNRSNAIKTEIPYCDVRLSTTTDVTVYKNGQQVSFDTIKKGDWIRFDCLYNRADVVPRQLYDCTAIYILSPEEINTVITDIFYIQKVVEWNSLVVDIYFSIDKDLKGSDFCSLFMADEEWQQDGVTFTPRQLKPGTCVQIEGIDPAASFPFVNQYNPPNGRIRILSF